jgi:hypothetical protein
MVKTQMTLKNKSKNTKEDWMMMRLDAMPPSNLKEDWMMMKLVAMLDLRNLKAGIIITLILVNLARRTSMNPKIAVKLL